jgi:2-iminobutanoate/2-iminopropanoate deaminase
MSRRSKGGRTTRRVIVERGVPTPVGPYSHAVAAGGFFFVSGQGPKESATGRYVQGGVGNQTRKTLRNVTTILGSMGLDLSDVVKVNAYLRDIKDFQEFNDAYGEFFKDAPPARTTVQATPPAAEILVEMEATAKTRD